MNTIRLCPECGQPLAADALLGLCPECMMKAGLGTASPEVPPAKPAAPGERVSFFGDYELLEEVARGGMGVVWKARQVSLNRIVAVKMILSGRLAGDAEVMRFRTEAEAAAKLQHPNIVAIHEVGEHEGQHYFSMDFVEGQSLAEMVFHRPLPPEQAARYLQAIAEAIHYAHQKGVLHRDLKPSNVLIDHAGQPRVTDFGLAKLAETDSGLTHSGAVMGSPSYMSPEQASGKTREIGPATDIYSLGAILYELITGRPPFRAATPLDTMRTVVESETAAPRWVNSAVPADLETICLKCLEKDPHRRYATAQELADDLRRFLHHEPIQARPATRLYRTQKWIKRKPAIAALAGVSALAALVLVAGLLRYAATLRKHSTDIRGRYFFTLVEQARAERLLGHREAALQRITEAAAIQRPPELRTEAIQAIAQPGVRKAFDAPVGALVFSRFSPDGRVFATAGEGFVPPDWPGYASNAWRSFVRVWDVASGRVLGGSWSFSPDDFDSPGTLFWQLRSPAWTDRVSQYLVGRLSNITRSLLDTYRGGPSPALERALVDDLNLIIAGPSIYDARRFENVRLRPQTQDLLKRNPQGEELVWFNRLLLEDACPRLRRKLPGAIPWHLAAGPCALSPDSGLLAVPQFDEETGVADLALRDVRAGKTLARLPASGPARFSPDGACLAVQESNRVSVWSVAGSTGHWPVPPGDPPGGTGGARQGSSSANVKTNAAAVPVGGSPTGAGASPTLAIQKVALHDRPAAIYGWSGPEELLLQGLPDKGYGRLVHWNVVTGKETFPLNDTAYTRTDGGAAAESLPGYSVNATTEVAVVVSSDHRAAVTRRLRPRSTPEELSVRDLVTGLKIGSTWPVPFPERLLLSAQGRSLVFPDSVEPGRLRVYDVNRDKFLVGVGEPGVRLAWAFSRVAHGPVASSGTSASGSGDVRHESRHLRWSAGNLPTTNAAWISFVRNFSPDGTLFAAEVSTSERNLALWELASSRRFAVLPDAWSPVWSDDGHWLAVSSRGQIQVGPGTWWSGDTAQVWEVLHGVPTHRLPSAPRRMAFSPDGRQLTANLENGQGSVLWDVERGESRVTLRVSTNRLHTEEVFFSTNGAWALNDTHFWLGGVLAQAAPLGQSPQGLATNDSSTVLARALAPDGRRLLLACMAQQWQTNAAFGGNHLQLWDLAGQKRLAVWPHPGNDRAFGSGFQHGPLVFSPDGRRFALACYGGSGIEVWDAAAGKRLHELHAPQWWTNALRSPRPSIVAQILRSVFRIPSAPPSSPGTEDHFMESLVKAIRFTPDSRLVVSCAEDRAVIREVESGRELAQCRCGTNVLCLAISPDGRTLATGDDGREIRLWELPSGRELTHWPAHEAAVTALVFSPDGATLASGARDGTMKLWNLPFLRAELKKLGLDW